MKIIPVALKSAYNNIIKMSVRKVWTEEEDLVLKLLKQDLGQKKWSVIAVKMQEEYKLGGRTGKQCRQRYHNHLDSSININVQWVEEEEQILFEKHAEVGNKWSVIAHHLKGRSDNCVKNHFYSKLRKTIRKLNKIASQLNQNHRQIKSSLLSKIIETTQEKFKISSRIDEEIIEFCLDLKNRLFIFDSESIQNQGADQEIAKKLIEDILSIEIDFKHCFKNHKKSSKHGTGSSDKNWLHPLDNLRKKSSNLSSSSEFSEEGSSIGSPSSSMLSSNSDLGDSFESHHNYLEFKSTSKGSASNSFKSSKHNSSDLIKSEKSLDDFEQQCHDNQQKLNWPEKMTEERSKDNKNSIQKRQQSNMNEMIEPITQKQNSNEEQSSSFHNSDEHRRQNIDMFYEDSPIFMRILGPRFSKEDFQELIFQSEIDEEKE